MTDFGKVLTLVIIATAINANARIRTNKEPVSVFVSGGALAVILLTLGELWRWDIVYIMTLLFFVSSLVINGKPLLDGFSQFLGGIKR